MTTPARARYTGYRFPAEIIGHAVGSTSASRSGCAWLRSCWPPAASSSAAKPCGSGRASSAGNSPIRSVAAFPGLATNGIGVGCWVDKCSNCDPRYRAGFFPTETDQHREQAAESQSSSSDPPGQLGLVVECAGVLAPKWGVETQERGEFVRVVRVPARQRRAVPDDVLRRPQDAAVVDVAGDVVVGADDVEVARRPSARPACRRPARASRRRAASRCGRAGHAGEGRARHQQVRGDLAARDVAQRVREPSVSTFIPALVTL